MNKVVLRVKLLFVGLFIGLGTLACWSSGGVRPGQVSIANSRTAEASLFRQNCAICHGIEGHGRETEVQVIPSLRTGKAAAKTEQQIYEQIYNGGNGMTPFKYQLSETQIRRLATFIHRDVQGRS